MSTNLKFSVGDTVKIKKYRSLDSNVWVSKDGSAIGCQFIEVVIVSKAERRGMYLVDVTDHGTSYRPLKENFDLKSSLEEYCIHPRNLDVDRTYVQIYARGVIELVKGVSKFKNCDD